jgi:phosphate acetyltransferase
MTTLSELRKRAAKQPKRILFPESDDPRVIEAACRFESEGLGKSVLFASEESSEASVGTGSLQTLSPTDPSLIELCAEQLKENRKHRGMTLNDAKEALSDRLLFAALLLRTGKVDGCVSGSLAKTSSVIRAGLYGVGLKPDCETLSSFFLMHNEERAITFADCGVVPEPTAEQLAEIAVDAAENHQRLTGETPCVAMLSFSTLGSAEHERVDKVRQALKIIGARKPDLIVDGELQFDAAFVPTVAARKAPDSPVAGKANVFVFPNLESGNIAYKIAQRMGGYQALGPIIQGLRAPFMDLSRGCSVDDIVDVAVIASVLG